MSGKELHALQCGQCMIVLHVTSSKVAYRTACGVSSGSATPVLRECHLGMGETLACVGDVQGAS